MIIYIEGVDGSGKTTLKEHLAKRLKQLRLVKGIEEIIPDGEKLIPTHPTRPGRLTGKELLQKIFEMTIEVDKVYICDRGPISDIIYRTFDEHKVVTTLRDFCELIMVIRPLLVMVHCDSDKSLDLMKARGDENPIAYEKHKELRYLYQQLMGLFGAIKYDVATMGDKMQDSVNLILAILWEGKDKWIKDRLKEVK